MNKAPGGQPGNPSQLTTGKRTQRHGMVLAELGTKYPAIYRDIRHLRRVLERQTADPDGTIPVLTGAKINQACRWELTARIAQRMVADGNLGPAETLNALNTMTHATRQRDALLGKLDLNGSLAEDGDVWGKLDAQRAPQAEPGGR